MLAEADLPDDPEVLRAMIVAVSAETERLMAKVTISRQLAHRPRPRMASLTATIQQHDDRSAMRTYDITDKN